MRRIVYLLFLLFTFISLSGQIDVFEEKQKAAIKKNSVKGYTVYNHTFVGGKPKEDGYKNIKYTFDNNGNLIEEVQYKSNGNILLLESFQYDSRDFNTGYKKFDGKKNKITAIKKYKYDSKGNKIIESGFDGISKFKNKFEYSGNKLKSITYGNVNGSNYSATQKRIFTYSGNNVTIKVYDGNNKFLFKIEQTVDSRGNIIESKEYKKDGSLKKRFEYKFSGYKLTKEVCYYGTNFNYEDTYIYDSQGRLKSAYKRLPGSSKFESKKIEYDSYGKITAEYYRKKGSDDFSYKKYSYNSKGLATEIISYYANYNYKVLFRNKYEYF